MVGQLLFDAGARVDTKGKYRQLLYDLSKAFRRAAKRDEQAGVDEGAASEKAARGGRSNGTPHPAKAARETPKEQRSNGASADGGGGGSSLLKRPRVENGDGADAAAPAALEHVFEQAWTEPSASAPAADAGQNATERSAKKKQRKSGGGGTPGDGVVLTPRGPTISPASQYATPASALTPYGAAARKPTPTPPVQGAGGSTAKAAATTPRPTPGGAKRCVRLSAFIAPSGLTGGALSCRVRWALSNIELFTPTGAPQTAAGKQALRCASAPKPTLRRNTPLSARVAATAAAAARGKGFKAGGKQRGTPHSGGGSAGKQQQMGTPGSAPRPRAVDFF